MKESGVNSALPSEQWQYLEQLFHESMSQAEDQRISYAREACGSDLKLFQALSSLLQHAGNPSLESPPALPPSRPALQGRVGQRCGSYRLVELIGQGGMGSVWQACRDDDAFEATVAVKLLTAPSIEAAAVKQFRAERQFLARLRHPGIAALLDGGTNDEGQPFLVMEHIDGQPIDDYCDSHHSGIEARIRLLLSVCEAVQHAHQNLVLHGDLKPSNILVTHDGRPCLLDFGVAEALDVGRRAEDKSELPQAVPITPRYCSPEQLERSPLSTTSDVYALGVILYELLTLDSPYRNATTSIPRLIRAVCQAKSPPPSQSLPSRLPTGASVRSWRKQIQGDLDAIVMRCLSKQPLERYPSVEALTADLRAWLGNRPVAARTPGTLRRMTMLIARHRIASAALIIGFLGLITGLLLTQKQTRETQRAWLEELQQRRLAESRLDETVRLNNILDAEMAYSNEQRERAVQLAHDVQEIATKTVFDVVIRSAPHAPKKTLRELVMLGVSAMERVSEDLQEDDTFLRQLAVSYSELGLLLGSTQLHGFGQDSQALEVHQKAVALARRAASVSHDILENHFALARTGSKLAQQQLACGMLDEAAETLHEALDACTLIDKPGAKPGFRVIGQEVFSVLGRVHFEQGSTETADDLYWEACLRADALAKELPHIWTVLAQLANACTDCATTALQEGDVLEALELAQEGVDWHRRAQALAPDEPRLIRSKALALRHLASIARVASELDRAEEAVNAGIEDLDRLINQDPNAIAIQLDRLDLIEVRARILLDQGDVQSAEAILIEAIDSGREIFASYSDSLRSRSLLCTLYLRHAEMLRNEGRLNEVQEDLSSLHKLDDLREFDSSLFRIRIRFLTLRLEGLVQRDRSRKEEDADNRTTQVMKARQCLVAALDILKSNPAIAIEDFDAELRTAIEELTP